MIRLSAAATALGTSRHNTLHMGLDSKRTTRRIALFSPYHGGSHAAWAEGWYAHSRHQITLFTLPDRFWKWRMHGAAVTLARRLRRAWADLEAAPDLIVATDMLDLTTLLALTRDLTANIPTALYLHENQLTYPLPADPASGPMRRQRGERDYHYAFINFASMCAADVLLFNSAYHRDNWFDALPRYLNRLPEYRELGMVADLRRKAYVLPVGVDLARLERDGVASAESPVAEPPLILWNQRWEYDKNPKAFFEALYRLQAAGVPFRVALGGQNFSRRPTVFDEARRRLNAKIIHTGYATARRYVQLLWEADVTISTARHEFFGISIVEAAACNTVPLLPNRLSYPELLPPWAHPACLYADDAELDAKLHRFLRDSAWRTDVAGRLAVAMQRFRWERVIDRYDAMADAIAERALMPTDL